MFNPHPPLTGFPIVITTLFIFIELYSLLKKKDLKPLSVFLLSCLLVFSISTFISGFFGFDYANTIKDVPENLVDQHQSFAKVHLILLVLMIIFYSLREFYNLGSKFFITSYFLILIIFALNIYYVGFLGGELVFKHGAGVAITTQQLPFYEQ